MTETNNQSGQNNQIKSKDSVKKVSFENKQQDNMSQPKKSAQTKPIISTIQNFYKAYKNEISLTVLILYVLTLAVATIIELIEH